MRTQPDDTAAPPFWDLEALIAKGFDLDAALSLISYWRLRDGVHAFDRRTSTFFALGPAPRFTADRPVPVRRASERH